MKARKLERAEFMAGLHGSVAALMDKGAGKKFTETMKGLTAEDPEEFEAVPVDPKVAAAVKRKMDALARGSVDGR